MPEDNVKRGRSFELLVKNIEQILSDDDSVIVESPKRLRDRVTGSLREHDIVITRREKHRELLTAIECRERSRPVGKPQIEAFEQKCNDTRVDRGVIVSSSGFADSAVKAAKHYNIQCLTVDQALAEFDWLLMSSIDFVRRKVRHTHIALITEPYLCVSLDGFSLQNGQGDEVPLDIIVGYVNKKVSESDDAHECGGDGACVVKYKYSCNDLFLKRRENGELFKVVSLLASVEFEVEKSDLPLSRFNYVDVSGEENVLSGAFATIDCDGIKGKLYVTMGKDGGAVSFISEPITCADE